MIKKAENLKTELKPNLKGGNDTVSCLNILNPDEMYKSGRMFSISTMPPGCSIGYHDHSGEYEVYYILKGKALVNDNGTMHELNPGDMMQCRDGEFHGIENVGDTDLEYVSAILNTGM